MDEITILLTFEALLNQEVVGSIGTICEHIYLPQWLNCGKTVYYKLIKLLRVCLPDYQPFAQQRALNAQEPSCEPLDWKTSRLRGFSEASSGFSTE